MSAGTKIVGMMFVLSLFLSPLTLIASDYDHEIKTADMVFQWKVDHESRSLHVRLSAKTKGWASVGFNTKPVMKGADFIVGYVKNGAVKTRDDFGVGGVSHISDVAAGGRNDISNVSGSENGGVTTISFTIPLNSGDDNDLALNVEREIFVLLAYGRRDNFNSRHKFRTSLKASLAAGGLF